jgi:hypothetical protein
LKLWLVPDASTVACWGWAWRLGVEVVMGGSCGNAHREKITDRL